ncbi:hypothetical protein BDW02DRAFT_295090 [Decorospora gaudefroyi]|uniref:Uncharacterized protein n=1 Tax=Decorospora gaudefroyi TaxID=184978 RepID=A0A6A5KGP7_9PLEO|nr:hypothetical protein BDW02DRAFT_295090 [Decorospora gaudefroyi]
MLVPFVYFILRLSGTHESCLGKPKAEQVGMQRKRRLHPVGTKLFEGGFGCSVQEGDMLREVKWVKEKEVRRLPPLPQMHPPRLRWEGATHARQVFALHMHRVPRVFSYGKNQKTSNGLRGASPLSIREGPVVDTVATCKMVKAGQVPTRIA